MKKLITAVLIACTLIGCGQPAVINNKYHKTQGLLTNKDPNICYEVSAGNVILAIITIRTVVLPVYFIGWSIFNPTRAKTGPNDACAD